MSDPYSPYQTPSPYAPPQPPGAYGGYPPHMPFQGQPPTTPGVVRAAAVMLGVVGGLILVVSVLMAALLLMIPVDELRAGGAFDAVPPEMDPQTLLNFAAGCFGVCGGVLGLVYLSLTPFVWKGNRAGVISAIVFLTLTLLLALLHMLAAVLQGGGVEVFFALAMDLVVLAIGGVLLFLLVRSLAALRFHGQDAYAAAAAQHAAWQSYYAQQQQQLQQQPPPTSADQQRGWGDDRDRGDGTA